MKIEVLGPGCPRCNALAASVRAAVMSLGLDAEITKVTDINEITSRGVMLTPALVVDGQIKASGRVPSPEEIQGMLS
ncbi:MAG: TM0996/MTH895 family glutaredoxin-like protein [Phycisphaerae bacterium]|nr:TM0996/MTH895 family glutaredoxin-like protein [Phycisphaerae bacterium]